MLEARYYEKQSDKKVRCQLCPHACLISPGRAGLCFVRYNDDGRLVALTYERVSGTQLDPIEKKPLHFFHPGSKILSVGAIGCNMACFFCQNWQIAQPKDVMDIDPMEAVAVLTEELTVEALLAQALRLQSVGNIGVAFTYNEPFIWFEYVLAAARALQEAGLKVVLVTNGYVSEAPLLELLPYIDALNIDIKGITDQVYRRLGGGLEAVIRTAELAKKSAHIELTNLLVPEMNTAEADISALVDWVADSLGADTPLHFSRYFPSRQATIPSTTATVMQAASDIANQRLNKVVLGNI